MLANSFKGKGNFSYYIMLIILLAGQQSYAQEHADCVTAYRICSINDIITVKTLFGPGQVINEAHTPCLNRGARKYGDGEAAAFWVKWKIKKTGKLFFVIHPLRKTDDIDFYLYKIKKNESPCSKEEREIVRCMTTGASPETGDWHCLGATGLRIGHTTTSEDSGCRLKTNSNQFLRELDAKKGEEYIMLINNSSRSEDYGKKDGFSLYFGGDADFECPDENMPEEIAGTKTELREEVEIQSKEVTIKVWDNQIIDGDIISIYLNHKKIVDKLTLTKEKNEYKITLTEKENYITIYSDSFGKIEPNTVSIIIDDYKSSTTLKLRSSRKKLDTIKLSLIDD